MYDIYRRVLMNVCGFQAPANNVLTLLLRPLRFIVALLAVPYALLRALLRTLGLPLPLPPLPPAFSITGLGLNLGLPTRSPPPVRDAKVTSERWVRALEEETGCIGISRTQVPEGESSGVASGSGSITTRRTDGGEAQTRVIPDFFIGSYESFVRALAKEDEARVGCVVLVSEEHDDVAEFKRSTLTDPEFVRLMKDNDFLVWGGDIRDRDPWSGKWRYVHIYEVSELNSCSLLQPPRNSKQPHTPSSPSSPSKPAAASLPLHHPSPLYSLFFPATSAPPSPLPLHPLPLRLSLRISLPTSCHASLPTSPPSVGLLSNASPSGCCKPGNASGSVPCAMSKTGRSLRAHDGIRIGSNGRYRKRRRRSLLLLDWRRKKRGRYRN